MSFISGVSESEIWFYGGIATMIIVAVVAVVCCMVLILSGWKIKQQLEREYGVIEK